MMISVDDISNELSSLYVKLSKEHSVSLADFADAMRQEADIIDSSCKQNIIVFQRWGALPAC